MSSHEDILQEVAEGINRDLGLVKGLYHRFILGIPQVNTALIIAVQNEGKLRC